jgi:acyl carrier protein
MQAESNILNTLTSIFREIFDQNSIVLKSETTAADTAGWDSYKQIMIILSVQERFEIRLRSREIDNLRSVGDLVKVISSKLGN